MRHAIPASLALSLCAALALSAQTAPSGAVTSAPTTSVSQVIAGQVPPPDTLTPPAAVTSPDTLVPVASPATTPIDVPPMSPQEWNRTAVKDPHHLLDGPADDAPRPSAQDLRGITAISPGVELVRDDPRNPRVYPITALLNHATLIQVPYAVEKAWCGDLEAWTLEGDANYVSIKPLTPNVSTNLHILTTNGRMFNFRLYASQNGSYTDVFQVRIASQYRANTADQAQLHDAALTSRLTTEFERAYTQKLANTQFDWTRQYAANTFWNYRVRQASGYTVTGIFNDQHFTYFTVSGDERPTVYLETRQPTTTKERIWTLGIHRHHWVREVLNYDLTRGNFYRVQALLHHGQRLILVLRRQEAVIYRAGRE